MLRQILTCFHIVLSAAFTILISDQTRPNTMVLQYASFLTLYTQFQSNYHLLAFARVFKSLQGGGGYEQRHIRFIMVRARAYHQEIEEESESRVQGIKSKHGEDK